MRTALWFGGVLTAGGLVTGGSAGAQDLPDPVFSAQNQLRRPGNVDPLDLQPQPAYEALGLRVGNYTLRTTADVAPVLNTNVRVRPRKDGGVAGFVAPTVQLRSNGEHNPLVAFVSGSLTAYSKQSTETVGTLTGGIDYTHELERDALVRVRAEGGRFFEDRALSFAPANSYRPVKFDRVLGGIDATLTTARLTLAPSIEVDRLAYHDGRLASDPTQVLIQRTRSYTRVEPELVAGYAVTNTTALYVGGNVNTRRYDLNTAFDSHGYAAYAGVRLRPTALTRIDAAFGYQRQYYRFGLTDPKGLYARVSGLYSPDRLTQIEVEYRRDISETGGVQVGGLVRDRYGASVRRDVLRNFRISGAAELRRYDFSAIRRKDDRLFARAEARYVLTRDLDLFARAEQVVARSRGAPTSAFDFNRTTVLSGVTLKL